MKRSSGEGTICKRADGRWAAALAVGGRRIWVYGKTRQEVAEKLRRLQGLAQSAGYLPEPGKLTLRDYLTLWLEQAGQRLRPKTLETYEQVTQSFILPHLGTTKLARLSGLVLASFFTGLAKDGISPFRQRQAFALLHKALGDAVRWGLIPHNPASTIDRPKPKPAKRTIWTAEQTATFLQAVEVGQCGRYGDLFAFLLASGCRLGEALGLRWSDVNWQAGVVRIERQITEVRGKPVEGRPKSEAGVRTIALPHWGLQSLERQKTRARQWQMRSDNPFALGWQRCFVTEAGTVPEMTNVRRALLSICQHLGLPPVRVHDLRHISLSLLASAGVPVKELQQRAGHSTPTLTMQVYLHAAEDGDLRAAQALERLRR